MSLEKPTLPQEKLDKTKALKNKPLLFGGISVATVVAGLTIFSLATAPNLAVINLSGVSLNSESSADKMMMPFVNYEYSASDELSKQSGSGNVYQIKTDKSIDTVLKEVVAKFDVTGAIIDELTYKDSAAGYTSFTYGEAITVQADGSTVSGHSSAPSEGQDVAKSNEPQEDYVTVDWEKPNVSIWQSGEDGLVSWYYASGEQASENVVVSKATAEQKSKEMLASLGYNANDFQIDVNVSDWGAYTTASLKVEGELTNLSFSFDFGKEGKLRSVSGSSFQLVKLGSTSLLSPFDVADNRSNDYRYYGQPYYDMNENWGIAYSTKDVQASDSVSNEATSEEVTPVEPAPEATEPVSTATPEPVAEPTAEPTPTDAPIVEPTAEPVKQPETIKVTLKESSTVWLTIYDTKGVGYLVKGYKLTGEQNVTLYIIAIPDSMVNLPKLEARLY